MEEGLISEDQIDQSLRRILRGWFELGMLDPVERVPWSSLSPDIVDSESHSEVALRVAQESMTLLKNNNDLLPLSKDLKRVAVIGANAVDSAMLWGNYNGFPSSTVTILNGIRAKLPNAEIIYERGCDLVDPGERTSVIKKEPALFDALTGRLKEADVDVIIYAGGLSPRLEGEEMPVNAEGFKGG